MSSPDAARAGSSSAPAASPTASPAALRTRSALLQFQDTLLNVTGGLNWYDGMPCPAQGPAWDYVNCSSTGDVTGLELSLLGLSGECRCFCAAALELCWLHCVVWLQCSCLPVNEYAAMTSLHHHSKANQHILAAQLCSELAQAMLALSTSLYCLQASCKKAGEPYLEASRP